jgi:hypothetical protein
MCTEFWLENMNGTDHLADLETGDWMVLRLITKKYYGRWILLLQLALQPLVGFGLLYNFVPQSSIFTHLSPVSHFHLL